MLSKEASNTIFEFFVWLDLGLNPSLLDSNHYAFIQLLHHELNTMQGQSFKQSTAGFHSKFSVLTGFLIKAKEQSGPFYLAIAGAKTERCLS